VLKVSSCIELHAVRRRPEGHAEGEGEATAPTSIPLIPAPDLGGTVIGRDGRAFRPDMAAIINDFAAEGTPCCVDWEHGTESRWMADPQKGGRAAGWLTRLYRHETGALYADVEWTPDGAKDVADKAYRFISPAIFADDSGRAFKLSSCALTNRPNLRMPAVHDRQENTNMQKIAAALGLPVDASEDKIVEALHARINGAPDPEKWAPKADFVHAMDRASKAEAALAKAAVDSKTATLNSMIEDAVKAGKFAPASADLHRETYAALPDGVDRLKRLIDATPATVHATTQTGGTALPKDKTPKAKDPKAEAYARAAGLKPETIAALEAEAVQT
jgi:phage I-like protein